MHSTVYFTINSLGTQANAKNALLFSMPGIILFILGNFYNFQSEGNIEVNNDNTDVKNSRICQKCGSKNYIDFVYCSNSGSPRYK